MPCFFVGAGSAQSKFEIDSQVTSPWENVGFTIKESAKGKTAFQIGGGIEFRLIKIFALGLDARYIIAKANGEWTLKDNRSDLQFSGKFVNLDFGGILFVIVLKIIL